AYLSAPSGVIFLLGVVPDRSSPLPVELERRIESVAYIRQLAPRPTENLPSELQRLGLREVSLEDWAKSPPKESASLYLSRFDERLATTGLAGEIPDLVILNPETPVHFYKRRWTDPRSMTGRFVGRRPQRYGADLWCYVELDGGRPQRLLDLPV